jgi:hypothetical protein
LVVRLEEFARAKILSFLSPLTVVLAAFALRTVSEYGLDRCPAVALARLEAMREGIG